MALLLFVLLSNVTVLHAQESQEVRFALEVADTLRFHRVATDGSTSFVYELSDDFALQLVGGLRQPQEWIIPAPISVTLSPSPNGDRIAFIALQNYTNPALFWIDLDSLTLHQSPLPGIGGLQWSPDSSAILVSPAYTGFGEILTDFGSVNISEAYLHTVDSASLTPLPNPDNQIRGSFEWLDSNRILFLDREDCEALCINSHNLFLFNISTESVTRLTDIGNQLPNDIQRDELQYYVICALGFTSWSATNASLYYSVSCLDTSDRLHSYLYSIDTNGHERLEIDTPGQFPEDFATVIRGIYELEAEIFITVESQAVPSGGEAIEIYGARRVVKLTTSGNISLISETRFSQTGLQTLYTVKPSPNKQYLAIAGTGDSFDLSQRGYYEIIDLEHGEALSQATMPNGVCTVEWFDDTHLLLVEYEADCLWAFDYPIRTTLLDVTTGAQERLFSELDGQVWLLN